MNIGIVYRIFYGELNYIGSTTNLKQRMRVHISNYKNNNNNCSSKEIICFDDYEVEILAEIYYVENNNDINLRNLEREYMEQYVCVNKLRAIVSKEESKEYNKEYHKEHYLKNHDERLEYQQQYVLNNRDKIKAYKKDYYLKNKVKLN